MLTNCLHLLKSASTSNPQFIDRIMGPFMRIVQKLYRDHLNATSVLMNSTNAYNMPIPISSTSVEGSNLMIGPNSTSVVVYSELLIQSLELVKYRIGVMSVEMRKMYINLILVNLIEKSVDLRLIRYLNKIISEWIKYKNGPLLNQIPSLKEKLILLQRLAVVMEKRFAEHADLQQSFLETIAYVYKDEVYSSNQEFKVKLEQAFVGGLKCTNPLIRQSFFEIFNTNFNCSDLYERLCYIVVTQNWESFGAQYWIKQCIQMTLGACAKADANVIYSDMTSSRFQFINLTNAASSIIDPNQYLTKAPALDAELNNENIMLNLDTSIGESFWTNFKINSLKPVADLETLADTTDFLKYTNKKFLNIYTRKSEDQMQVDNQISSKNLFSRRELIENLIENQFLLYGFNKSLKISDLIVSLCQLCHLSSDLAHQIWIQLFIQMFNLLNPKQQQNLYGELTPFIASGSHCIQKQTQLSTINTFLESFALAKPVSLFLRPSLLAYLAKNHNLWHRAILLLENSLIAAIEFSSNSTSTHSSDVVSSDQSFHVNQQQQLQQNALQNVQHETFSSLSQLYSLLKEDDYRAGIW
jgi:transformation/transcription domain-associated protein